MIAYVNCCNEKGALKKRAPINVDMLYTKTVRTGQALYFNNKAAVAGNCPVQGIPSFSVFVCTKVKIFLHLQAADKKKATLFWDCLHIRYI